MYVRYVRFRLEREMRPVRSSLDDDNGDDDDEVVADGLQGSNKSSREAPRKLANAVISA